MSKAQQQQQQEGGKQPIINISNVITNTNQQQEVGSKQPSEQKKTATTTMSLSMETAIASGVGAVIGIGSSFLPKEYTLPVALGAAVLIPKKNKGFSTALILVLSWLIMFTIFYQ